MRTITQLRAISVVAAVATLASAAAAAATTPATTPALSPAGSAPAGTAAVEPLDSIPDYPVTNVTVTMSDFALELPAEIPAGLVIFEGRNVGAEEHHMTLVKIPEGETFAGVMGKLAQMSTDPGAALAGLELYPGPNGVAPGASQSVLANLTPGQYVALCVIPSHDGVPHAAKGMVAQLTVTGEATTVDIPAPVITLADYSFSLPAGFAGHGIYQIDNSALQPHEIVFYKVPDGTTKDQVLPLLTSDPTKLVPAGGTTAFSNTQSAWIDFDMAPGTYAVLCFIPDGRDGKPHFAHGMVDVVTVP